MHRNGYRGQRHLRRVKDDFGTRRLLNDPIAALPCDVVDELHAALRAALDFGMPALFANVARWAAATLVSRGISHDRFRFALHAMRGNLTTIVPVEQLDSALAIVDACIPSLETDTLEAPCIDDSTQGGGRAKTMLDALLNNDEAAAAREALLAIAKGMDVIEVYETVLTPLLYEAGRLWQRNELSVAHEHAVTSAVERIMGQLIDLYPPAPERDLTIVSAAVGGGRHQVGARMIADAFALAGWRATYLGSNLPVEDVLSYVDDVSVDVLALSAALPRDAVAIRDLVASLETRPVAPVVIVGGRAFASHPSLWRAVGADGYAPSAATAVALAGELVHHCSR